MFRLGQGESTTTYFHCKDMSTCPITISKQVLSKSLPAGGCLARVVSAMNVLYTIRFQEVALGPLSMGLRL